MRRNEWMKYYTTEYERNPKTGKPKPYSRYIGPWYTIEATARRGCRLWAWLMLALAVVLFAVAGLTPSWGSMCTYVLPWYMLCLLPMFYLLMGAWKLSRLKDRFTEIDKEESLAYIRRAGLGLGILGAAWAMADGVFLLTSQWTTITPQELIFLGCGVGVTVIGFALFWRMKQVRVEEAEV